MSSTIIAPASGTNRSGVIVIRVSGNNSRKLTKILTNNKVPKSRFASLRKIYDKNGDLIDNALVIFFEGPNSFTGEDVVEFHIHGGPSVLSATINSALETGLVEFAKAGEFTKRAFHNGKLDLTQSEGLADLIDAETEAQRKQAIRQMSGGLSELANKWRLEIIECMAEAEAYLDFPDEDLPSGLSNNVKNRIINLINSLNKQIENSKISQKIRDGLQFVIIGAPNVGKSSILNAIAGRDVAIVSSIAGTTRDIVEISIVINGYLVSISDTAGLRETNDIIEQEGVKRALLRSQDADINIGVINEALDFETIKPYLRENDILIWNKSDIFEKRINSIKFDFKIDELELNVKNNENIELLINLISNKIFELNNNTEAGSLTRLRHFDAVKRAIIYLENSLQIEDDVPEIACENLRMAIRALAEIVGIIDLEEIYDKIFSSFCIGK